MIDYTCSQCGCEMSSPASMLGKPETCPVCGKVTIVPRPEPMLEHTAGDDDHARAASEPAPVPSLEESTSRPGVASTPAEQPTRPEREEEAESLTASEKAYAEHFAEVGPRLAELAQQIKDLPDGSSAEERATLHVIRSLLVDELAGAPTLEGNEEGIRGVLSSAEKTINTARRILGERHEAVWRLCEMLALATSLVEQRFEITQGEAISPAPRPEAPSPDLTEVMPSEARPAIPVLGPRWRAEESPVAEASEAAVPLEWQVGDVILDLYQVEDVQTSGGMYMVYRVHHRDWDQDMAVRSPRPEFFESQEQKESFVRECLTWIGLGLHPHIVSCYYVRTLGGIPRIFAEYVEGGSLSDWVRSKELYEGGPEAALARILDIAIQSAWGLHHAHEQGLVHQDFKPANVLMKPDGTAKVTGFGLAKARTVSNEDTETPPGRSALTSAGGVTPTYCSPEQAGKQGVTHKTDIWSWGATVLEMFTGEAFWDAGEAAGEALSDYLETRTEDPLIPRMPDDLADLLSHCFQRNPDDRPSDMQAIALQLREVHQRITGTPHERETPVPADALADTLNNRAISLLDLGQTEEAETLLEAALEADVQHPEATYNLGLLQWRSCRITDDVFLKRLTETRDGGGWRSDWLTGLVHLGRGDGESAVRELECAAAQSEGDRAVLSALSCARSWEGYGTRCLRVLDGHPSRTSEIAITSGGRFALTATGACAVPDNKLLLWDLATGQCVRTFEGHTDCVDSVAISPDDRLGLSGSKDGTVRVWDLLNGNCLQVIKGHKGAVEAVAFSHDGRWAISGGDDKTLRLWDLSTGSCQRVFEGHIDPVLSVCLSADGQYALSGSKGLFRDEALKLWDVATGECLRNFEGQANTVYSVCLSADGRYALSGGGGYTQDVTLHPSATIASGSAGSVPVWT